MNQYLRARNEATPALIHTSSNSEVGSSRNITKLVECPVVDKVPALDTTLYSGQWYTLVTGAVRSTLGIRWIIGRSENSYLGLLSASIWVVWSHRQPYRYIP